MDKALADLESPSHEATCLQTPPPTQLTPWLAAGTAGDRRGLAHCWNVLMFPAQMVPPEEEIRPVFKPLKDSCSQQLCRHRAWHPLSWVGKLRVAPHSALPKPLYLSNSGTKEPQSTTLACQASQSYCPFRSSLLASPQGLALPLHGRKWA